MSSGNEFVEFRNCNGHRLATVFHDAGGTDVVIFCHGFMGSSIGPSRFFVRAARELAAHGISSLRFDQFGSGNSEGDFVDSSFEDWITTASSLVTEYLHQGFRVGLFGQSMGAATAIVVAARLPVAATVAWVPDPNIDTFIDTFVPSSNGVAEEAGQLVQDLFWQEAHAARVAEQLPSGNSPAYIVQCTDDVYVDADNRGAISTNAQPHHIVEVFEGYRHSDWSYAQATDIISKSVRFLVEHFPSSR
jgi:uncharacterized protein